MIKMNNKIKYCKESVLSKIDSVYKWFNCIIIQRESNRTYQDIWEDLYKAIPYRYILDSEELLELVTNVCKENYNENFNMIKEILNQCDKKYLYEKLKMSKLECNSTIKNYKIIKYFSGNELVNNDFMEYFKRNDLKLDINIKLNEDSIYLLLIKAKTFEEKLLILNEVRKNNVIISAKVYQIVINAIKDRMQLKQVIKLENSYSNNRHLLEFENAAMLFEKANEFNIDVHMKYDTNPPKEEQLALVVNNESIIKYIDNPSIDIQMAAVKNHLLSIKYIKNPFPEVEQEVINELNEAFIYLTNTEKNDFIKNNCILIKYIKTPSYNLKIEAVKQDGLLIRYLFNPSRELQLEAVRQNYRAIKYINNPDIVVQIEAVRINGFAIKYVKQPALITQIESVISNGYAIQYIDNPHERVQLEAAKQGSEIFKLIKNPSINAQKEFIKCYPEDICFVNNLSPQVIQRYYDNFNKNVKNKNGDNKCEETKPLLYTIRKTYNNIELYNELKLRYNYLFDSKVKPEYQFTIINNSEPLNEHINFLCKEINIESLYIASGFIYKSGLKLIESIISTVKEKNGELKLIVGSLQNYMEICSSKNDKVVGMDKETAIYINNLLNKKLIKIRTFHDEFYHGKYYFLKGYEKSCVIIGSSNVSLSGFIGNRELNILYVFDNNSKIFYMFKEWFENFWIECIDINELNTDSFNDIITNYDTNCDTKCYKKLENKEVRKYINELTDEEVKKRLKIWLDKEPDNIFTDLKIDNLKDYILIEFQKYKLIVLESFQPGNSYYYFKNKSMETLLDTIRFMSKSEIFILAGMPKHGYHTKNSSNIEVNINSLFIKKYKNNND